MSKKNTGKRKTAVSTGDRSLPSVKVAEASPEEIASGEASITSSDDATQVSAEEVSSGEASAVSVDDEVQVPAEEIASEEFSVASADDEVQVPDATDEAREISATSDTSPSRSRRFWPPSRQQLWTALAFGGVVLLGAVLRFWGLADKPLHHDESMHAYFSWLFMLNNLNQWAMCAAAQGTNPACYQYNPILHGPFQFHAIALTYKIAQWLGVYDNGVNNFTARIPAATLGSAIVGLPYFLRRRLGVVVSWFSCFFLAISPSLVYYSRFAREDIYMAFFTFLTIVGVARYLQNRKVAWLVTAALAFGFSYATKEATFLSVAVFGSFMGGLLAWELGTRWTIRQSVEADVPLARYLPRTGSPIVLFLYLLVLGIFAKWFFGWLNVLSIFVSDPRNKAVSDAYVQGLKNYTVAIVPWIGILLGCCVLVIIVREMLGKVPPPGRHGLAKHVDPQKQPLLDTLVTMPWTHWFFAVLTAWAVFLVLYSVLFTNIRNGIGDGIWQGLYYWVQQQQVARGGQPWYYYLMLIPLYEQIGVVFGLVGVVRCLLRPTRFRLFLVFWCVGNLFIYSWAGEKMPWLVIHITMPMMLLAAIGIEPVVLSIIDFVKIWQTRRKIMAQQTTANTDETILPPVPPSDARIAATVFGFVMTILLLLPTVHNMYEVTYVHAADAPHEMMIYVQTSVDVNVVMQKIEELDQKYYGGHHAIPIGIMDDPSTSDGPTWPFAWYLRDYTKVCFSFPNCLTPAKDIPVILTGGGDAWPLALKQYGATYLSHLYPMRVQWDQGYMPPACVPSATNPCTDPQPYVGVGPWLWLSYGDSPPPGAKFDLGRAVNNIWQWWWDRKAFGSTDGAYDMGFFIRKDMGVAP
jgi:predicted membrane-bound mannosyltransferase